MDFGAKRAGKGNGREGFLFHHEKNLSFIFKR